MNLLMMLKIYANNIQILHRHLIGANWNSNHVRLQSYYEEVQKCLDDLTELFMSIGYKEPSLQESLDYVQEITIEDREAYDSFKTVQTYFRNLIAEMNRLKSELPGDVVSKMEEYQEWFRLEADYKLKQELGD